MKNQHWSTDEEIMEIGLIVQPVKEVNNTVLSDLSPNGQESVYIGGHWNKRGQFEYLSHGGPEHILVFGVARSGKSVGIVIPALLTWNQSAVVYDVGGEYWSLTAGFREKELNNRCIKFNPAENDFNVVNKLMNDDKLFSLYITVHPADKERLKPAIRQTIDQILAQENESRRKLLLIIDDFPSLGKLDCIDKPVKNNVKMILTAHTVEQVIRVYDENMIFNHKFIKINYAANTSKTAELVSGITGLTVDEAMNLPRDDMIISINDHNPIYGTNIKYYQDVEMLRRTSIPASDMEK